MTTPPETLRAAATRLRQPISAHHPALIAPALAEPLAALLEVCAEYADRWHGTGIESPFRTAGLTLARAILSDPPPPEHPTAPAVRPLGRPDGAHVTPGAINALPDWIAAIDEPDRQGFACQGPARTGCMERTDSALVWSPQWTARQHIERFHPEWIDPHGCVVAPPHPGQATGTHAPEAPQNAAQDRPGGADETPGAPGAPKGAQAGADGPGVGLRDRIAQAVAAAHHSGAFTHTPADAPEYQRARARYRHAADAALAEVQPLLTQLAENAARAEMDRCAAINRARDANRRADRAEAALAEVRHELTRSENARDHLRHRAERAEARLARAVRELPERDLHDAIRRLAREDPAWLHDVLAADRRDAAALAADVILGRTGQDPGNAQAQAALERGEDHL